MPTTKQPVSSQSRKGHITSRSKTLSKQPVYSSRTMLYMSATLVAALAALSFKSRFVTAWTQEQVPEQAQFISPKSWAVLDNVPPPSVANGTTVSRKPTSVI